MHHLLLKSEEKHIGFTSGEEAFKSENILVAKTMSLVKEIY